MGMPAACKRQTKRGIDIAVSDVPEGQKRCSKCKAVKDLEGFHRDAACKGGRRSDCKSCSAVRVKAHYAENREALQARQRVRYHANRPKERLRTRRWEALNKARRTAYKRRLRALNPDRVVAAALRRLERERLAPGGPFSLSREDYKPRVAEFGGLCAYCRRWPFETLDHVTPLSREGGTNHAWNIVPACNRCNREKNARTPEEWVYRWYLEEEISPEEET